MHAENKLEWCIKKAKKEGKRHRGIREVQPDEEKVQKHINKAYYNIKVMISLIKQNFLDWATSASFYAHYHCLLAVLQKFGYESRNQECTFNAIEYLILTKKIDLRLEDIYKIRAVKADDLEEEDIVTLREEATYETETTLEQEEIKELLEETKHFVRKVEDALENVKRR